MAEPRKLHLPVLNDQQRTYLKSFRADVMQVHSIEMSSICNFSCPYCVQPWLVREKKYIERRTFVRALEWVAHYVKLGTQGELGVVGIGESTMHPDFVEFIHLARDVIGPERQLILPNNGSILDEEMVKKIADTNPTIYVSLHQPAKAKRAIDAARKYGLLAGVDTAPATATVDWAGQLPWVTTTTHNADQPCAYLSNQMVMAMADGRMTACAFDSDGSGVVGHVDDKIGAAVTGPYGLCTRCHHSISFISGYDQRGGP